MKKLILISFALCLGLTACAGRELSNVTLIQAVGVDGAGAVILTAVEEGEEGRAPALYTARGPDVDAAQAGLKDLGTTRLELTHVSWLVLGPEADVEQTLWDQLTCRESGCGARVWLAEGPAADLLAGAPDPCGRLRSLEENAGVRAPTLLEALSTLLREGRVELPAAALEGGELRASGTRWVEKR